MIVIQYKIFYSLRTVWWYARIKELIQKESYIFSTILLNALVGLKIKFVVKIDR